MNNSFFSNLTDSLSTMTGVPEDIKDKILSNVMNAIEEPVNILITGPTGCGKSSTINAMFNMEVAEVGTGCDPRTMKITDYKLGNLRIYDSPGLGDGRDKDVEHAKKITELLHRKDKDGNALIDLVLVIVDGSSRDLGTTYELIEKVIAPSLGDERHQRLLIGINQADLAMKSGHHWDYDNVCPDEVLTRFLDDKARSIKDRIEKNTGISVDPIYYSAGGKEEGEPQATPYNLSKLMLYILRAIPAKKRLVVAEQANTDQTMWRNSDEREDYGGEIRNSLLETIIGSAAEGRDIGEDIGGAIGRFAFGSVGERVCSAIGGAVGGFLGAVGGFFGSFFN